MTVTSALIGSNVTKLSEAEQERTTELFSGLNDVASIPQGTSNSVAGEKAIVTPDSNGSVSGGDGFDIVVTAGTGPLVVDDKTEAVMFQGGGDRTFSVGNDRKTSIEVVGGEGNDTLNGGTKGDAVSGGQGADSITAGMGRDTILGGDGNDVLNGDSADADSAGKLADLIGRAFASTVADGVPTWFDSTHYLQNNPDVAAAIQNGGIASAYAHFVAFGEKEGRAPNEYFNETYYLANNSDVAAAVQAGLFTSGFDHFLAYGGKEGRKPISTLEAEQYLDAYADIETAVTSGSLTAYQHAVVFGGKENRGNSAEDSIDGGSGNDLINGGVGDDLLLGGIGNDTIHGGQDDDTMTGGTGADTFVIEANSGIDRITDFSVTEDKIQLSGLTDVTAASLVSSVTSSGSDAVVTLSTGNTITLVGVAASQVTAAMFEIS